jgi:hypothetical protein
VTLHVSILGIDGSGKSTVAAALPAILAAEFNLTVGSAGDGFRISGPQDDSLAPKFQPEGLPLSARLAARVRVWAKRAADNRRLYPPLKLAQMILQDSATRALATRHRARVLVSDGNTVLSATGRAANYLSAASDAGTESKTPPTAEDLCAVFAYLFDGKPLPAESAARLPDLRKAKLIKKLSRLLWLDGTWLPDIVIFLDLSPEIALKRIAGRGKRVDRHENPADLAQARAMYLKTVEAFKQYRGPEAAHVIDADDLSTGETIAAVCAAIGGRLRAAEAEGRARGGPLGTTELSDRAIQGKAFNPRYVTHYLLAKFFSGAWREPTFFVSGLGRLFLREGYSAGLMTAIYDRDEKKYGLLDRIFLEYPLHRAVYDRLHILTRKIELELERKLSNGEKLSIVTAPSGFAYDLFRPLEAIAGRHPEWVRGVRLVAADLDPHGVIEPELKERARALGVDLHFYRGDMMGAELRAELARHAPFDLALFVGLSSWLPKPQTVSHLRWLRGMVGQDSILVTDCFTPAAYALSGRYVGYKASYYTPEVYRALVDFCGFDGRGADVESGRDEINHVLCAKPRLDTHHSGHGT